MKNNIKFIKEYLKPTAEQVKQYREKHSVGIVTAKFCVQEENMLNLFAELLDRIEALENRPVYIGYGEMA